MKKIAILSSLVLCSSLSLADASNEINTWVRSATYNNGANSSTLTDFTKDTLSIESSQLDKFDLWLGYKF